MLVPTWPAPAPPCGGSRNGIQRWTYEFTTSTLPRTYALSVYAPSESHRVPRLGGTERIKPLGPSARLRCYRWHLVFATRFRETVTPPCLHPFPLVPRRNRFRPIVLPRMPLRAGRGHPEGRIWFPRSTTPPACEMGTSTQSGRPIHRVLPVHVPNNCLSFASCIPLATTSHAS